MANLTFHKVASLPGTLLPNAFYYVENAPNLYAESYLTDDAGNPFMLGNTIMIQQVAAAALSSEVYLAADIAARDALTLTVNSIVLVQDATGDATVTTGAALYFYSAALTTFTKVAEYESLDVVLDWNNIVNGPTSTPAQIDQAVADSHVHANLAVLDAITNAGSGAIITAAERTQITTNQTDIAALQAISHTHANIAVLDLLGVDGDGCLTYNALPVGSWTTVDW